MTEFITSENIARRTVTPMDFRNSYRNNKTVWVLVTRGMIPLRVHVALRGMAWLPNTPRAHIEKENMEVAAAYEQSFDDILRLPECGPMPWAWTYEEDNLQPRDVFLKLFDAIWTCIDCGAPMPSDKNGNPVDPWVCQNGHRGLDAISGLYRTKTIPTMPMCYGDPLGEELDFRPLSVEEAEAEGKVIECNGIAMGCTLWKKDLFKRVSKPWFRTLTGAEKDTDGAGSYTQDLWFCRKAKEELGRENVRFAVHTGVSVGHLCLETGEIF